MQFFFLGLLAAPLVAQTQIGGGTCNSSSLNGAYALSISGRQVNASGTFTGVMQASGSATFDGLSTVTIAATENTSQAVGTSLTWTGTYSVEANCAATVSVTAGGNATLNVAIYNQGKDFLLTGSDATYSYSGSAVVQPTTTCAVSTLNGVYTFNATGFTLATDSVSGIADGAGLLQFDGQGNLTVNVSTATSGTAASALSLTGTYAVSSSCQGSATLTDSHSNAYAMGFSVYSVTAVNTNFYATLARSGSFLMLGAGHTPSVQPAAGTCSTSSLSGVYSLELSGRGISGAGTFTGSYQGIGTATFDGQGNVTLAGADNTNLALGTAFSYTGTYSLPSNCSGALTVATTGAAMFTLVVWDSGSQFRMARKTKPARYSSTGKGM
jgi:hypothetical protein